MNEHQLRRLLRRVLLSAPLPLAVLGAACGGSSLTDQGVGGRESGGATSAGANNAGATSAGANNAGATSAGANNAGTGGSLAGAGVGGSLAGGGTSGAGAGAGGAVGGSSGAGGSGGGAAGGTGDECKGHQVASCATFIVTIPKSCLDTTQAVPGTVLSQQACNSICNVGYVFTCSVSTITASDVNVTCNPGCAVGRRPEGMSEIQVMCDDPGGYFAQIAQLEAASVTAFRVLRDELRALGAPKSLLRAAGRAARDEVRHARATAALARRFGGTLSPATIARPARRSLETIALENAVEGCVRETYGALLATRQAQLARDPVVRSAMMRIARDETRHASLSWRVGRWLEARLEPAARRNVEHAKERAARELRLSLANEPACHFAELAGLPSPTEAEQLAGHMARLLWS